MLDAPRHIGRRLHGALVSPVGCAALFLTFWACLSLLWTPFPEEAADRFFNPPAPPFSRCWLRSIYPKKQDSRSLPAAHRPRGRKRGDARPCPFWLVLVFGGFEFDETLFERSMITSIVLVWPALGMLSFREHWISAALLAILVAAVALAGFAQIALLGDGRRRIHLRRGHVRPRPDGAGSRVAIRTLDHVRPALPLIYRLALRLSGFEPGAGSALC